MWLVGSEPLDVYLGLAEGGLARGGQAVGWSAHDDVVRAAAHWFAQARSLKPWRPRVRVWVSGALARPFVWGPIQGLARWREVQLAAAAAAVDATGLAGPCAVSLEEWPASAPALVVAIDQHVVAAIVAAARAAGVRLASLRPWWTRVLDRTTDASMLAARDHDALTVLSASQAAWQSAYSYLPAPTVEQASSLVDRVMLAAGVDAGAVKHAHLAHDAWPQLEKAGA